MDNLQVRLSEDFRLGWLVCAIESEGSFQLAWGKRKNNVVQLVPRINVGNSEQDYIEQVVEIAEDISVPCHVSHSGKMVYATWYGMKRVLRLLDVIEPLLVIKRDRAKILRQFVEHRLTLRRNQPYDAFDKELFLAMRALNGAGRVNNQDLKLAFERNLNDYMPNAA